MAPTDCSPGQAHAIDAKNGGDGKDTARANVIDGLPSQLACQSSDRVGLLTGTLSLACYLNRIRHIEPTGTN